jgi:hypothetical protein
MTDLTLEQRMQQAATYNRLSSYSAAKVAEAYAAEQTAEAARKLRTCEMALGYTDEVNDELRAQVAACLPVIAAAGEVCGHVDLHLEEGGSLNPFIHASTDDLAAALALYDETPPHGGETPVPA